LDEASELLPQIREAIPVRLQSPAVMSAFGPSLQKSIFEARDEALTQSLEHRNVGDEGFERRISV